MIEGLKRHEINKIRNALRGWYNRPVGQLLLDMEREQLDEILPTLFGYHIVQVGCLLGRDLLTNSRISHRLIIDPDVSETLVPGLVAYPDALPLNSDSVDVVLLPHTLEFERNPHHILREVDRILIPEGHVVVLGFNPWSIWGLLRLLRHRKTTQPPWCGDFLSYTRTKDWLALLGFDIVSTRGYFYRPPLKNKSLMKQLTFMEKLGARLWSRLSGAYIIVAKKRVTTITPIKPRWRSRRKIMGGLVEPSARSTRSND